MRFNATDHCCVLASVCGAQNVPAEQEGRAETGRPATPAPSALLTPSIIGPIQELPPALFKAGQFGKISGNGLLRAGAEQCGSER